MAIGSTGRFVVPENAVTHFHLANGDKVADFGAGAGYFTKALSRAVGNDGKVYACEIQRGLVEKLGEMARNEKLSNVEPMWCDLEESEGTKLADGILDAGIMVNTLFQIEDKETTLKEIARVLEPGGKFFVIDWTESFGGLGPQADQVVDENTARTVIEEAGFQFAQTFDAGEHHYGLVFRRV